jgi:hypothetical protein
LQHALIVASALLLAAYAAHAQLGVGGTGLDDLFQTAAEAELVRWAGSQFDPAVVAAFVEGRL